MSIDEITALVVGLAATWLAWFLVSKRKNRDQVEPPTPIRKTTEVVVNKAVEAIHDRHDEAMDRIDAITASDTPATDTAELLAERARTPKDES